MGVAILDGHDLSSGGRLFSDEFDHRHALGSSLQSQFCR